MEAEIGRVSRGADTTGSGAAAAPNLTCADDAFGLAQEEPVGGHAEVAGALEERRRDQIMWSCDH